MLADTHCHLDFEAFNDDRDEVIARARAAGVEKIMNPGLDLPTSKAAVRLAETYSQVYAAVGIHPNDALTFDNSSIQELRELASHPRVKAVGEIGLDYYRKHSPHDVQRRVFNEQLMLAGELGLPVIIHNREADEDMLAALADWCLSLVKSGARLAANPGVLHSFSSSTEVARRAIDLGFMIGFTGPITFKNAPDLQQTAAILPLERVLVETDSPFLAPHPKRGKRNEPAFVRFTTEKLAALHDADFETTARQVSENARQLFDW